jgi:hypothetical protein
MKKQAITTKMATSAQSGPAPSISADRTPPRGCRYRWIVAHESARMTP